MDIFTITQLNDLSDRLLDRLLALVPESRREKVFRLRTDNRKRQSLLSYALLVYALRQYDGVLQLPELNVTGKPRIKGREDLHCSLSHCPLGVAAVVHNLPVGVDIEVVRPYNPKLARYVCSIEEVQAIEAAEDPALAFTILWTKKESCIKLYGGSVSPKIKHIADQFCKLDFDTKIGNGWVLTACCEKE
jgi:4'-phosphopantetheinyl transferase